MKNAFKKKMNTNLLNNRLKFCMISGTILGLMDCLLFLTDNLVSGRLLGELALSGLTIMNPLTTFIIFASVIIPLGTAVSIAYSQGEGNIENANKQFSQGMIISLVFGTLLSVFIGLFGSMAIGLLPVSKEVASYAGQYCMGLILMPFFQFLNIYLYYIYVGQGYENICIISSGVRLVLNIILDFILCSIWGTFGIGIATSLSYFASVLLRLIPLFRSKLRLRFKFYLNGKNIIKNIRDGLLLSADSISPVLFATIMNVIVLNLFHESGHIVLSIILTIENIYMSLFFCLANSIQALICHFYAEDNYVNIRKVIHYVSKYIIILSCVIAGFSLLLSNKIPIFFGIKENIEETIWAIRLYVPFVIFLGLTTLMSRYYVCIRHKLYGFGLLFFSSIILPVLCSIICSKFLGMRGIWLGLGIGYIVSFILNYAFTYLIKKKSNQHLDPILLFDLDIESRQLNFNLKNTQEEVMNCVYEIDNKLKNMNGLSLARRNKIILMIEENGMNIIEKIPNDDANIEINIICPKEIKEQFSLIIRSDHFIPDISNQDYVLSSFRDYVLSNMVLSSSDMYYLLKKKETTLVYKL